MESLPEDTALSGHPSLPPGASTTVLMSEVTDVFGSEGRVHPYYTENKPLFAGASQEKIIQSSGV